MPMYWALNSIPELAGLPQQQQVHLWRRCYGRAFVHWQVWVAMIVFLLSILIGQAAGHRYDNNAIGFHWFTIVGGMISGMLGAGIFGQMMTHWIRPHLRAERDRIDKIKRLSELDV
jgi:hypothetical protein